MCVCVCVCIYIGKKHGIMILKNFIETWMKLFHCDDGFMVNEI